MVRKNGWRNTRQDSFRFRHAVWGISPFLGLRRFYFDIDAENRIHLALFSAVTRSEDEDETVIRLSMAGIRPRSARFSSQNCAQKAI